MTTTLDRINEWPAKTWTLITQYSDGGQQSLRVCLIQPVGPCLAVWVEFNRPRSLCHAIIISLSSRARKYGGGRASRFGESTLSLATQGS